MEGRRKNRNIGGTAYTIKRAGVVNDSAPESCADCVFGAFFGGSASHQRVFFRLSFSLTQSRSLVSFCWCVKGWWEHCVRAGGKHLALDFCVQIVLDS